MTYQYLSQTERYQIYILMKDGKTQSQIAKLIDRHKSTISREIARNTGNRGYRPKQVCLLAEERSLGSRNATQITASDWGKAVWIAS
jgi:IS30 family transposase